MRDCRLQKILFTLSLFAICMAGCSQSEKTEGPNPLKTSVHLDAVCKSLPLTDSLVLDLVGPDTFHVVLGDLETSVDKLLNPGSWNFYAKYYANGLLVQQGEVAAELSAGEEVNISISMRAVAGFLFVRIPLGLTNPMDIASGELSLVSGKDSQSYPLSFTAEAATVSTGMLVIGQTYDVHLELLSSSGELLYQMDSQVLIDGENFALNWELNSLHADVSLSIKSDSLSTFSATAFLPSKLRAPKAGDLTITEFMTEGKDEFVEYYNASLDTLDLQGCSLWATSSSSFKSMVEIPETVLLPPDAFLIFGNDSMPGRDIPVKLSMPSTKGSIALRCGELTIDSLFYVSEKTVTADTTGAYAGISPFAVDSKWSLQLPLENYKNRENGLSWCNGDFSLHQKANCAD